jgi:hypothetical protein
MNDHTADRHLRAASRDEVEAALMTEMITQMAQQVIEFADDSKNESERASYLRMACNWLKLAADIEAQPA